MGTGSINEDLGLKGKLSPEERAKRNIMGSSATERGNVPMEDGVTGREMKSDEDERKRTGIRRIAAMLKIWKW